LRWLSTGEHIITTDRADVLVLVSPAVMTLEDETRDTHATLPTMAVILSSTHSAKAAFDAMERPSVKCHPEVALRAVIFTELNATVFTYIPLGFDGFGIAYRRFL